MDHHLSSEVEAGYGHNGYGRKAVLNGTGSLELEIPRDRRAISVPLDPVNLENVLRQI